MNQNAIQNQRLNPDPNMGPRMLAGEITGEAAIRTAEEASGDIVDIHMVTTDSFSADEATEEIVAEADGAPE